MDDDKLIMFRNRLQKVSKHLGRQAKRLQVSCYRIYDHDLPEFPFCIELYEDKIYVAEYKRRHSMDEEEHEEWMRNCVAIISSVIGVEPENIFARLRQRKPGRTGQYRKQQDQKQEFIVEENGLKFIINLTEYL